MTREEAIRGVEMDPGRTGRVVEEAGWGQGACTDDIWDELAPCAISWARASAGSQLCCGREGVLSVDAECLPSQSTESSSESHNGLR